MDNESKILKLSVMGTLFFAVLGISWGWLVNSDMILFDGIYSFIGVILSSASLFVCKIIKEKDNRDFYFGKYILEPLIITINSLVLTIMCTYSMISSIQTLLAGGNSVNINSAFIYSIISTIGCAVVFLGIKSKNKQEQSELIKSETVQWFMDFLLSGSIFIGFLIVIILSNTKFKEIVVYIDPIMVLLASMVCVRNPIKRFVRNFKEVVGLIKPEKVSRQVEKQIKAIENNYGFLKAATKVMKRGRSIQIEINFSNEESSEEELTLEEMNLIKDELIRKIDTGRYYKDLKVIFEIGKNTYIEMTS